MLDENQQDHPIPTEPEERNQLLCAAASDGDAKRLKALIEQGLSPNGYWSEEKGESRGKMARQGMANTSEEDAFDGLPEDLRDMLDETTQGILSGIAGQFTSAPFPGEIPLFAAAGSGNPECVRVLLEAGADVSARDYSGHTALFSATSEETIRVLVDAGLSLEDTDSYGWTPLVAALRDDEDGANTVARALIAFGADVNSTHDHGTTMFMTAANAMERSVSMMRLLVEAGADPHAVTDFGDNAFHMSVDVDGAEANEEGSVRSVLGYLKELGVDIELRNDQGQTPLAVAIDQGTGLEVRVLCELGADPNVVCAVHQCGAEKCEHVEAPVIFAAVDGMGVDKEEKLQALIDAGADPLVKDAEGSTPVVRLVAVLCADAPDNEQAFRAFFTGLSALRISGDLPEKYAAFIGAVKPVFMDYVESFAADIPIPTSCGFEAEWRAERLSGIATLATEESWLRRNELGDD